MKGKLQALAQRRCNEPSKMPATDIHFGIMLWLLSPGPSGFVDTAKKEVDNIPSR